MARKRIDARLRRLRRQREREGKPSMIGKPYETSRELVEEGERKRPGTNLDIGEERSQEQLREIKRWRRR